MTPMYRTVNKDFFKIWSPEMAYVLGFFAADGYMWISGRGAHFFGFQINDRGLLVCIREVLSSNHKIATRTRNNPKWNNSYRLQIGSKEMFEDLLKLGMTPVKSKTLTFPKVSKKYFGDFVRGYFDGGGTVYFKEHFAKDRGKKRWVFHTRFTSGSKSFLESLHADLKKEVVVGGYLYKKNRGYELVFSHHDSAGIFRLMYLAPHKDQLYLKRKYDIFMRALKTLKLRT